VVRLRPDTGEPVEAARAATAAGSARRTAPPAAGPALPPACAGPVSTEIHAVCARAQGKQARQRQLGRRHRRQLRRSGNPLKQQRLARRRRTARSPPAAAARGSCAAAPPSVRAATPCRPRLRRAAAGAHGAAVAGLHQYQRPLAPALPLEPCGALGARRGGHRENAARRAAGAPATIVGRVERRRRQPAEAHQAVDPVRRRNFGGGGVGRCPVCRRGSIRAREIRSARLRCH